MHWRHGIVWFRSLTCRIFGEKGWWWTNDFHHDFIMISSWTSPLESLIFWFLSWGWTCSHLRAKDTWEHALAWRSRNASELVTLLSCEQFFQLQLIYCYQRCDTCLFDFWMQIVVQLGAGDFLSHWLTVADRIKKPDHSELPQLPTSWCWVEPPTILGECEQCEAWDMRIL